MSHPGPTRPANWAVLNALGRTNIVDKSPVVSQQYNKPWALYAGIGLITALVIGGGSVGLLTALILKDKGVESVVVAETNPLRRELIALHTDFRLVDPIAEKLPEQHFDCVFDAVGGAATRDQSIVSVKSGGIIVHIGLMDNQGSMDVRAMTLREISFIGTYTYTPLDLQATLHKLNSGALGSLAWIEQRPLDAGAEAFNELLHGRCAAPKVVLNIV